MNTRHLALIVEDDQAAADDLVQIVASIECESRRTDNQSQALQLLTENSFCLVLLDLEIKQQPESIKGHIAHGNALLWEIRTRYGGNRGSSFWTPVIVISGHANEVDAAITMMKDGADDIIRKPLRIDDAVGRIRKALESAGRRTHDMCSRGAANPADGTALILRIPGNIKGRRARVTVSGKPALLPAGSIRILLQLAIARVQEKTVHKLALGAKPNEGFRAISRLREHLRPAIGEETDIVANDQQGGYSLKPEVMVTECDAEALKAMGDIEISRLAEELAAIVVQTGEEDGRRS